MKEYIKLHRDDTYDITIHCESKEERDTAIDVLMRTANSWIPVSERLPEPARRYLVTVKWEDGEWSKLSVYDAVYGKDGKWHGDNYEPFKYCEVLAWMPLPEPYND